MRKANLKFTLLFCLYHFISFDVSGQWKYVDAPSIGDVVNVKHQGDTLYALANYGGLFYKPNNTTDWKLIPGSLEHKGDDFIVSGKNIYLFTNEDFSEGPPVTVFRTQNLGLEWKKVFEASSLSSGNNTISVRGDTLIIGVENKIYYSINTGDTFHSSYMTSMYFNWDLSPVNDSIYIHDYSGIKKVSLKNIEFDMYYVKAIASFPENLSFDKMHICGSIAWFLFTEKGMLHLYKLSETQKKLILVASFASYPDKRPFYNTLGSNGKRVFVHKGVLTDNKIFYTEDEGITFFETDSIPLKFAGWLGDQIFTSDGKLKVTMDGGKSFSDYNSRIFNSTYCEFNESEQELAVTNDKGYIYQWSFEKIGESWEEIDRLHGYQWVKNSSGVYLVNDYYKFYYTNDLNQPLKPIEHNRLKYLNSMLAVGNDFYIVNRNSVWISKDDCISWNEIKVDIDSTDIFQSLSYNEGYYLLLCKNSIWISQNGLDFRDITYDHPMTEQFASVPINAFYQNGKVYTYYQSMFNELNIKNEYWNNGYFDNYIPSIYNVQTKLIPLGGDLIGYSTSILGFYVSGVGWPWNEFNDGLSDTEIVDIKRIDDKIYCINATGIWMRDINDFNYSINSDGLHSTSGIKVYPNPAQNIIKIEIGTEAITDRIQLYDSFGKVMESIKKPENENLAIDIHNLPSGVYFLQFKTQNTSIIKKVVVER